MTTEGFFHFALLFQPLYNAYAIKTRELYFLLDGQKYLLLNLFRQPVPRQAPQPIRKHHEQLPFDALSSLSLNQFSFEYHVKAPE